MLTAEQEVWMRVYVRGDETHSADYRAQVADDALVEFRKRFPPTDVAEIFGDPSKAIRSRPGTPFRE